VDEAFTVWGANEPDRGNSRDCVAVKKDNAYFWNAEDCEEKLAFICGK